ncbi:hypothetical protein D3C79_536690 [compost metagenome]
MIDHAQAQVSQAGIQGAAFVFARHQNRLVRCVRLGKDHPGCRRFEAIGTAKQINLSLGKGLYRVLAAGKASHVNRQAQGVLQNARNVSGQALVVATAGGHVEGRVIRRRGAKQ